jgi:beta-galactosidase/beta-glucuronidase
MIRLVLWLVKSFTAIALLVQSVHGVETQRVYLSGRGKDDAVPWKFMCTTGALSGYWTNIPVPSNWDVLGFGHLTYKKDYSNSITECGLYENDFRAPKSWKDNRVYLVFEGAMTDTSAKLNGAVFSSAQAGRRNTAVTANQMASVGRRGFLCVNVTVCTPGVYTIF